MTAPRFTTSRTPPEPRTGFTGSPRFIQRGTGHTARTAYGARWASLPVEGSAAHRKARLGFLGRLLAR
jgi:hypothetical protein